MQGIGGEGGVIEGVGVKRVVFNGLGPGVWREYGLWKCVEVHFYIN